MTEHQKATLAELLKQAEDLLTNHSTQYLKIKDDAENDSVSVSLSFKLKGRKITTKIGYSHPKNTDEVDGFVEDPNQQKLDYEKIS